MSTRSRRSLVSNPITGWSVPPWVSTSRGMQCPQLQKTAGTFRPLERGLGLFAGLNILPKTTFATDYSYRTQREYQHRLLSGWLTPLAPLLLPDASTFCLDFHPIPYRGD